MKFSDLQQFSGVATEVWSLLVVQEVCSTPLADTAAYLCQIKCLSDGQDCSLIKGTFHEMLLRMYTVWTRPEFLVGVYKASPLFEDGSVEERVTTYSQSTAWMKFMEERKSPAITRWRANILYSTSPQMHAPDSLHSRIRLFHLSRTIGSLCHYEANDTDSIKHDVREFLTT